MFTEENINDRLLKKIKMSKYEKDIEFVKLFDRNINFLGGEKKLILIKRLLKKKAILIDLLSVTLMVLFSCYMLMFVT